MSMKQLISEITEQEGGKTQVSRAQVTEILGKLSEKIAKEAAKGKGKSDEGFYDETIQTLLSNGKRRLKVKKK